MDIRALEEVLADVRRFRSPPVTSASTEPPAVGVCVGTGVAVATGEEEEKRKNWVIAYPIMPLYTTVHQLFPRCSTVTSAPKGMVVSTLAEADIPCLRFSEPPVV